VDAPRLEVRPPSADAAEKLAAQARDVQVRDDSTRRLELRAVPGVAPAAEELCTPVAGRFAEQSCAAPVAAQQPDVLRLEPLAECSRIPPEALPTQMELVQLEAVPQDALAVQRWAMRQPARMLPEARPQDEEQPEPQEFPPRAVPALPQAASLPGARPRAD
jgi:hypothetical protein